MEERIALLRAYDTGAFTVTELCGHYGISRETFYEWQRRRDSADEYWFEDRSHATKSCPHRTPAEIVDRVTAMRRRRRRQPLGPKKIRAQLVREQPEIEWPAISTIGDILKRANLITATERQRRPMPHGEIVVPAAAPNDEWAIDFKGWFRTADGTRCDPLTITDTASRYLIEVRIVEPTCVGVRRAMERVFIDIGLPAACDPTTDRHSARPEPAGFRRSRCGGSSSASSRATFHRRAHRIMAGTSACIGR